MSLGNLEKHEIETLEATDGGLDDFLGEVPEIPILVYPIWEAFWRLRIGYPVEFPISIEAIQAYMVGFGISELFPFWLPMIQAMDSEFRATWAEQNKPPEPPAPKVDKRGRRRNRN